MEVQLSHLKNSNIGRIIALKGDESFIRRLCEMGFVVGQTVTVVKNAPLHDPIEYQIMGYKVSLRRKEADKIIVELVSGVVPNEFQGDCKFCYCDRALQEVQNVKGILQYKPDQEVEYIKVAFVGNPNCGKTTLFNRISGLNEHVGNYSGVTIDSKQATIEFEGYRITIVDLPGTYSITDFSPEERVVADFLRTEKPDIIVNVVDATNLERNLYLTTQIIDMGIPYILCLNIWDEFISKGNHLNTSVLSALLGARVIPTIAKRGRGVAALMEQIIQSYTNRDHFERKWVNYPEEIENFIDKSRVENRYDALSMAENDENLAKSVQLNYKNKISTVIATARYAFIKGALKESLRVTKRVSTDISEKIDNILTHKYLGLPIFVAILWLTFYTTFTLGEYPMSWIESGVGVLRDFIAGLMSDGAIKSLIVGGIIDGVGSVIVFLPNILILFFFISLMEDTGYMSRAAFITDKLMHRIGLHGKSFIPLVMGFGCNVPAIMSTRTIENRSNRLQTMLITPFMSCSARLPVYILVVSAFFPGNEANMLFVLYFGGILMAIISSLLIKKLFFRKANAHFVMELPPYRIPTVRNTIHQMWNKASQYLKKMGGIILIAAAIIWALGYFPHTVNEDGRRGDSYLEVIGKTIEPAIAPLGFDWKMGVSLVSGVVAKEVVVSSMSVIYNEDQPMDDEQAQHQLPEILKQDPNWNIAVALSFLTFVLLYFPCIAAVTAIRKESGAWKWAIFTVLYTTFVAWVCSFVVYNIAKLFL